MRIIVVALSLILSFSVMAEKNNVDVVESYSKHIIRGKMTDGDKNHPGEAPGSIPQGVGYVGILLDTPMDIRPLLKQLDPQVLKSYPALQSGFLEHIQVDLTKSQMQFYKMYYGNRVRITCNIDFVGRFYTPVYCEAMGMEPIEAVRRSM